MFMEIKTMTKFMAEIKMKTVQQAYRGNSPDWN